MRRTLAVLVAVAVVAAACGGAERSIDEEVDAPEFLTDRNGGPTTARALRGRPYNQSARNLDNRGLARFAAGAEPFDQFFLEAEGLGPDHDGTGCLSCHLDGTKVSTSAHRDRPPGLIVRISLPGTDVDGRSQRPVPTYGLQLTPESTHGDPEASIELRWTPVNHRRVDGSIVELRRPSIEIEPHRGELPAETLVSPRVTPPMIGLGLLEAIPESSLREAVAAQSNAGEVSGRLNEVIESDTGELVPGRFGWKAGQYSVESQTVAALHGDLGLTTPDDVVAGELSDLTREELDELVFYNRTIAVPISRGAERAMVRKGANLFESIGCSACHTPTHNSGPDEIAALSNVVFHPYTDLLLHDMGERLADGRPEFSASGSEWRTPPLWGLGRRVEITGAEAFLHDGRARTPEEAIYWHDGEARAARHRFELLGDADAQALLAFLDSL